MWIAIVVIFSSHYSSVWRFENGTPLRPNSRLLDRTAIPALSVSSSSSSSLSQSTAVEHFTWIPLAILLAQRILSGHCPTPVLFLDAANLSNLFLRDSRCLCGRRFMSTQWSFSRATNDQSLAPRGSMRSTICIISSISLSESLGTPALFEAFLAFFWWAAQS